MGVVYEAFHTKLEQPVAIKMMLPEMLAHPTLVARFEREARASAKLKSRHVARVYDVDATADGVPFIVMELLVGRDLDAVLEAQKQLPVAEAAGLMLQAAAAMREAHARGIVHRDLKPANLFLAREGNGVVLKVLDFGISTDLLSSATKLTNDDGVLGTVLYMSPEQIRGAAIDARSDIWALGALLYEILAGRPPFEGTITQVSVAITSDEPLPLAHFRSDVPPELEAIVRRALQKRPVDRFPDVASFIHALSPLAPATVRDEMKAESSLVSSPDVLAVVDATSVTLDARDRVMAPVLDFTANGMATEAGPRRPARGLVVAGVVIAAAVGIGAWTLRPSTPSLAAPGRALATETLPTAPPLSATNATAPTPSAPVPMPAPMAMPEPMTVPVPVPIPIPVPATSIASPAKGSRVAPRTSKSARPASIGPPPARAATSAPLPSSSLPPKPPSRPEHL